MKLLPFDDLSVVRKALMWWFDWPGNPYICITGAIDFTSSRAYLERLRAGDLPSVTVQHLLAATVSRVLREFPQANARIVGRHIQRLDHVGIAMPVDLEGHAGGAKQELGMALVERVDTLSLREVTGACARSVAEERAGEPANAFVRRLTSFVEKAPFPVLARGLDLMSWLAQSPLFAEQLYRRLPVSTGLTNPGAAFGRFEGALFRAASLELPQRLFHVGTLWGVSAVQDEVLPVDGEPKVRPVLPLILVFDHRLFDGILAGRILTRFSEILRSPEDELGATGDRRAATRR